MGLRPKVDAVFFAGDVLAIGAMMECIRRGWEVPKQVAIAGFDDWEVSRQFATPITALDIPRYAIGERAAELTLRRLDGHHGKIPPVNVGFASSSGKAPRRRRSSLDNATHSRCGACGLMTHTGRSMEEN